MPEFQYEKCELYKHHHRCFPVQVYTKLSPVSLTQSEVCPSRVNTNSGARWWC